MNTAEEYKSANNKTASDYLNSNNGNIESLITLGYSN